jgi:hypothetical protein
METDLLLQEPKPPLVVDRRDDLLPVPISSIKEEDIKVDVTTVHDLSTDFQVSSILSFKNIL